MAVMAMNTAKELILKLLDEIPESKAGEIIDFLLFLKSRKEQNLHLEPEEEAELWKLIQTDERISADRVDELLKGEE